MKISGCLWRNSGGELKLYLGCTGSTHVRVLHLSMHDSQFVDHTARIWWGENGTCLLQYVGHNGSVNSLRFHPTQDHVLTASGDQTAHVWKPQISLPPHIDTLVSQICHYLPTQKYWGQIDNYQIFFGGIEYTQGVGYTLRGVK